jgi:hypothetical protein
VCRFLFFFFFAMNPAFAAVDGMLLGLISWRCPLLLLLEVGGFQKENT